MARMPTNAPLEWDWEHPDDLAPRMDAFLSELAHCDKLEPVEAAYPLTRPQMLELGLTGIEFASWKTDHRAGLGTDLVPLRCRSNGAVTDAGRLYRVDGDRWF